MSCGAKLIDVWCVTMAFHRRRAQESTAGPISFVRPLLDVEGKVEAKAKRSAVERQVQAAIEREVNLCQTTCVSWSPSSRRGS